MPEEYGGSGAPLLAALVVQEELAKECRPAAFQVFEANTGPAKVVSLIGTDDQKQRYLPAIVRGDVTMAVAISEPDAGSAATDMITRQALERQLDPERVEAVDLQRRRGRPLPCLHATE